MKRIGNWDADAMYKALSDIGINMRELDKRDPSLHLLQELYGFLLHAQLLAWKAGMSHKQTVKSINDAILRSRSIPRTIK